MGPLALLNHAINFAAPALWLALLLPVLSHFLLKNGRSAHKLPVLIAINFIAGTVTLLCGLVLFGQDGKMLTYFSLVAVSASCQWFMQKG